MAANDDSFSSPLLDAKDFYAYSNKIQKLRFDDSEIGRSGIASRYSICLAEWAYKNDYSLCFLNMKVNLTQDCKHTTGLSMTACKSIVNNGFAQMCALSDNPKTVAHSLCQGIVFKHTKLLNTEAWWFWVAIGFVSGLVIGITVLLIICLLIPKKKKAAHSNGDKEQLKSDDETSRTHKASASTTNIATSKASGTNVTASTSNVTINGKSGNPPKGKGLKNWLKKDKKKSKNVKKSQSTTK